MKLNITKDEENGLEKWHIIVDYKRWENQLKKSENKLIKELEVPGFRKGNVPNNIAKNYLNENQIIKKATKEIIPIIYDFIIKEKSKFNNNNQPKIKIEKSNIKECEIIFLFDLPLEIIIGKYCDINIKKPKPIINQKEIDNQIKILQENFSILNIKEEGKLESGDIAFFDFSEYSQNEKKYFNESKNIEIEIGSGKFFSKFEDSMIGMKSKSTKIIEVMFPENYHIPNLRKKNIKFKIKLNEIKTRIINKNLQELIKDINIPNITNIKQLLENIKNQIKLQKKIEIKKNFMKEIIDKIIKNSKIIIPNFIIQNEINFLKKEFNNQLFYKKNIIDNYIKFSIFSKEEINNLIKKDIIIKLQNFFIIEEIFKKEKIIINENDIQNQFKLISDEYKINIEEIKSLDLKLINNIIKYNKVFDLLWKINGKNYDEKNI